VGATVSRWQIVMSRPPEPPYAPESFTAEAALRRGGRLLGARLIQFASLFAANIVVTRALGPIDRGKYAAALTFATIAFLVGHLALADAVGRLLARREAALTDLVRFSLAAAIALGSVAGLLTGISGVFLADVLLAGADTATVVLAAATVPLTFASVMGGTLLLRLGASGVFGMVCSLTGALQLGLTAALGLTVGLTPARALAVLATSLGASAVAYWATLARRVGTEALIPVPPKGVIRRALRLGVVLQVSSISLFLMLRVDVLLVSVLTNAREVGLYSLATTLVELVYLAPMTLGLAGLSTLTHADEPRALVFTADYARQNLALATVLALAVATVSYPLVIVLYGRAWSGSILPLIILSAGVIALAVEGPVRAMLLRIARPLAVSVASAFAFMVNVALNFALIPAMGISGAALASLGSYWCAAYLMLRLLRRERGVPLRAILTVPTRDDIVWVLWRRVIPGRHGGRGRPR
jgi:O-antigen/teichoic acid export membrane protein